MSVREVENGCVRRVGDAAGGEKRGAFAGGEVLQLDDPCQRRPRDVGGPLASRLVASAKHDEHAFRKRRQDRIAQPRVQRTQPLVGVDDDDTAVRHWNTAGVLNLTASASANACSTPRFDGRMWRASSATTGRPASAAMRANSRRSVVFPTPPGPCTCTTAGVRPAVRAVRKQRAFLRAPDETGAVRQRKPVRNSPRFLRRGFRAGHFRSSPVNSTSSGKARLPAVDGD